jgi:hypothetical protein
MLNEIRDELMKVSAEWSGISRQFQPDNRKTLKTQSKTFRAKPVGPLLKDLPPWLPELRVKLT